MKYQRSLLVGEAIERERDKAYKAFNKALACLDKELPELLGSLLKDNIEQIAASAFLAGSAFEQEQDIKSGSNKED